MVQAVRQRRDGAAKIKNAAWKTEYARRGRQGGASKEGQARGTSKEGRQGEASKETQARRGDCLYWKAEKQGDKARPRKLWYLQ
jgi:hypothetical protein